MEQDLEVVARLVARKRLQEVARFGIGGASIALGGGGLLRDFASRLAERAADGVGDAHEALFPTREADRQREAELQAMGVVAKSDGVYLRGALRRARWPRVVALALLAVLPLSVLGAVLAASTENPTLSNAMSTAATLGCGLGHFLLAALLVSLFERRRGPDLRLGMQRFKLGRKPPVRYADVQACQVVDGRPVVFLNDGGHVDLAVEHSPETQRWVAGWIQAQANRAR